MKQDGFDKLLLILKENRLNFLYNEYNFPKESYLKAKELLKISIPHLINQIEDECIIFEWFFGSTSFSVDIYYDGDFLYGERFEDENIRIKAYEVSWDELKKKVHEIRSNI